MDWDLSLILTVGVVLVTLLFFFRRPNTGAFVSELVFYPVKSCAGLRVTSALLDESGIKFDRKWAVLDAEKTVVSWKTDARLGRVEPELLLNERGDAHTLILRYANREVRLSVHDAPAAPAFQVSIDSYSRLVQSESAAACDFFRDALQRDYSLVRLVKTCEPHSDFQMQTGQLQIVSKSSLETMRSLLSVQSCDLPIDIFRANVVIDETEAFEEDTWKEFTVNRLEFVNVQPCKRPAIPAVAPLSPESVQSLLAALQTYHSAGSQPTFGIWAAKRGTGVINVGDRVRVRSRKSIAY